MDYELLLKKAAFPSSFPATIEALRNVSYPDLALLKVSLPDHPCALLHGEANPFGKLLAIPRNRRPISKWQNKDEAFAEVAREIRDIVERLKQGTPQQAHRH